MMTAVHAAAVEADRRLDTRDVSLSPRGDTSEIAKEEGYVLLRRRAQTDCRTQLFIALALLIVSVSPAFAQLDRGTISGTIKDQQGGVMPGVTVTATSTQTQAGRSTVTDGSGFYTFPNLQPGLYDITAELQGFKKASRQDVQLDAAGALTLDFALETGALTEEVTVTADTPLLQTDVAVRKTVEAKDIEQLSFKGRNPIGVAGLKAGVIGGNFNNSRLRRPRQRRLQHQRQPRRREQHHRRRRDRHPHAVGRHDHRHPERRRHPGSAGPDRQLHARVRPRQRRPDPVRDQERQQPLHRQRVVLLPRRLAAGQHLGAQPQHRTRSRTAARRRSTTSSTATPSAGRFRSACSRTSCSSSARRSGSTSSRSQTNSVTVPTEAMRRGDFSELLNPNNGFFTRRRRSSPIR